MSLVMKPTEVKRYSSSLHILYVEDSLTIRKAMSAMLQTFFSQIDVAANGVEGLEMYKTLFNQEDRYYDIVFTDLEMPEMNGFDLSRYILDFNPKQEIVVISSHNDSAQLIKLMNLGVKKFLSKPVEAEELQQIVYDVSKDLFTKRMVEEEQKEIEIHNQILKSREKSYLAKLQKNVKELEEFNHLLNESNIVSKTDSDGVIIYVNETFCTLSGYSSEELIGKKHNIVSSGDMAPSFFAKMWRTLSEKKNYHAVFKNRTKSGELYYVDTFIKPLIDDNGEISQYVAISHDVTQMIDSIMIAKKAEQQKHDFFTNIGHEMRTPLNAIIGFTSLLKRRAKDNDKALQMYNVIEESAQQLNQLIETALDIQQIHSNSFTLCDEEFDPKLILQACCEKYLSKANSKNQTYEWVLDASLPSMLVGDSQRLGEALGAVIDNAIKFTPPNGRIDVQCGYDSENLMLTCQICDNGIGIEPENLDKIFQITQLDGSMTRKHEGAGLGLTIANAIAKAMDGHITVHSSLNQGSTFLMEFNLPSHEKCLID